MTGDKPITPESPLGQLLAANKAPALPVDFADRVVARTRDRPAPLPNARTGRGGVKRWRSVKRLAIGGVVAGALATTAAATGLLDDLPISVPSVEKVWATITGQEEPSDSTASSNEVESAPVVEEVEAPVQLEGPIDTPEELEEAFRRVDEVRSNRTDIRRERVDQRIDRAIDRRREQGLPAPTPEQEERLKERIDQFRERRDERVGDRLETRRDELRERVEGGEELSREDFVREQRDAVGRPSRRERMEQLRDLPPEQRREAIRQQRQERRERRRQLLDEVMQPPASDEEAAEFPTQESPEPDPEIEEKSD